MAMSVGSKEFLCISFVSQKVYIYVYLDSSFSVFAHLGSHLELCNDQSLINSVMRKRLWASMDIVYDDAGIFGNLMISFLKFCLKIHLQSIIMDDKKWMIN